MSEVFSNIALGLHVALVPQNIFFCFIGVLLGTAVGVLPGLGPVATLAVLLPITFYLEPAPALIMLAGIYYGAQYGGSTTAILINLPGESSSAVTTLDGYAMARQGRAGPALAVAAYSSFFAGTIATLVIGVASPPLARLALQFGPAEYFSLMLVGVVAAVVLAHGSLLKAFAMLFLGLLLGLVGTDINSGFQRYTFGILELSDSIDVVPIAMGLFGVAELIANLERRERRDATTAVGGLLPTRQDVKQAAPAAMRGTVVGSVLGVLPGGGALLASFAAYIVEKKLSRFPGRFGRGAIEGVAGPEAANNAGAQTSFIPMLTLGIPSNAVMALMIGAMMLQGIQPGPRVMTQQPELFWGVIASMWIGNLMLLVINLPLIGIWVRLITVPYRFLFPVILLISSIGVYCLHNSTFEVVLLMIFGLLGYVFYKLGCEPAPLILGFILGPMMEEYLRRSMSLSFGDPMIFVQRPISLALIVVAAALLILTLLPAARRTREAAFSEGAN